MPSPKSSEPVSNSLSDSVLIRALNRQPVPYTPVWIMRQAGRYLPEYRETRKQAQHFLNLCQNPALACEVALQPLARFPLDAAILFSDILTIPDAMGLGLYFVEGEGPAFRKPLHHTRDIEQLYLPNCKEDLGYVLDAVALIREKMPAHLPLIGFSGSPWTLACYMVEGQSSREFKRTLDMTYNQPELMHLLLGKLTQTVVEYLKGQILAGANVLMVFDTWGGILPPYHYHRFTLHYLRQITEAIKIAHPEIPLILFSKGAVQWLTALSQTGCDALGLDWTIDLNATRAKIGHQVALQGNLDPSILRAKPDIIIREVKRVLEAYGAGSGHIFNLGHGITPDIPPSNVAVMVEAVKELSAAYHQKDN